MQQKVYELSSLEKYYLFIYRFHVLGQTNLILDTELKGGVS